MKLGSARILVLSAEHTEYVSKTTGQKVTGCDIWYVAQDDKKRDNRKGSVPINVRIDASEYPQITACPGFFDADMFSETEDVTKYGQRTTVTVVKPGNLQYVSALGSAPVGSPSPKLP